jgi:hypothetical protein
MGLGKFAMQAFFQFPNIEKAIGIEMARSRFKLGVDALRRLAQDLPDEFTLEINDEDSVILWDRKGRSLEFRCGDLFDCTDGVEQADVLICETHFSSEIMSKLISFLEKMKPSSRVLTFENLSNHVKETPLQFEQLAVNVEWEDRFPTTWNKTGHHFFLWKKK